MGRLWTILFGGNRVPIAFVAHLVAAPARREVLLAGILGNAAIIAMWVIAHTIGNPLGPMAGEIEEMGLLDTASKIAELTVIVCLAVLLQMRANWVNNDLGAEKALALC